jgi:hypothetical protein
VKQDRRPTKNNGRSATKVLKQKRKTNSPRRQSSPHLKTRTSPKRKRPAATPQRKHKRKQATLKKKKLRQRRNPALAMLS